MSKKDYGIKLAESLRQARQLGSQPAASAAPTVSAATPTPSAKPAGTQAEHRQSAPTPRTTRSTPTSPSSLLHPARVWPD